MDYNFKGADRINVYMDRSNVQMTYECYSGDKVLKKGFIGSNLRAFEMYDFLAAVYKSGANIIFGNGVETNENNLEEAVDDLEVLNRDSIFFQN